MNIIELYTMSSQELSKKEILNRIIKRELTQVKAAELLGFTTRHISYLLHGYKRHGVTFLISKKRGRISNRAKPKEFKDNIIGIVKDNYHDFGPTLASEKLLERHNIKIHHSTLRKWMIIDGVYNNKSRKTAKIHQSRERRDCFGELVQIDGSHHDWFEGRADKCCLIVFIDDATGLTYCRFEKTETTLGYMRAAKDYFATYGKPEAFYSDKHSIFKVNMPTVNPGETQFQRGCREINIELICAGSPQAKGRVERVNATLQDRLVKELRLQGVSSIEDANKFLPEFLIKFNQKFTKEPKSSQDVHRKINISDEQLDYILSYQEQRTLSKNLQFNFNHNICQITTKTKGYRLKQSKITVIQNTNHEIKLFQNNKQYKFKIIDKDLKTRVTDNKNINNILKIKVKRKPNKPGPNHPWKKYKLLKTPKVSQVVRRSLNNLKPEISKSP
jgi:hypothetical protein